MLACIENMMLRTRVITEALNYCKLVSKILNNHVVIRLESERALREDQS